MERRYSLQVVDSYAPKSSTPIVRRLIWMLLFIVAMLMAIVLLSQPRAVAFVQSKIKRAEFAMDSYKSGEDPSQQVAQQLLDNITNTKTKVEASDQATLDQVAEDNANDRKRFGGSNMPISRVPVNRFGAFTNN